MYIWCLGPWYSRITHSWHDRIIRINMALYIIMPVSMMSHFFPFIGNRANPHRKQESRKSIVPMEIRGRVIHSLVKWHDRPIIHIGAADFPVC